LVTLDLSMKIRESVCLRSGPVLLVYIYIAQLNTITPIIIGVRVRQSALG